MARSTHARSDVVSATATSDTFVSLESILRTDELHRRPRRSPDYERETSALTALVKALADSPSTILQILADKVLGVLEADSAGLSLLTSDEKRFYWAAIAGAWKPHVGGGTPRDFGPCGDVLDRNSPMLFSHWERRYPYLSAAEPLAEEGLLVPFCVNGRPVGTIWAIAHSDRRTFDAEDLRLLESMGRFASAAYQTVEFVKSLRSEVAARQQAEAGLRELADGLMAQVQERTEELRRSEAFLAEAQRLSRIGSFSWRVATAEVTWSRELYHILEVDPSTPPEWPMIRSRVHPDDAASLNDMISRARVAATDIDVPQRLRLPDGSVKHLHVVARGTRGADGTLEYMGVVQDVTERRVSEEALARARSELAHVTRLATVGELSAAIAHEINQPLTALAANGAAFHRWLSAAPPNLDRAKRSAERMVRDANSACEVVNRIRALFRQAALTCTWLNLNEVIAKVCQLMLEEASGCGVSIETDLERDLPQTLGDGVQLQQVIVNLVRNGIEAMEATIGTRRLLTIRSRRELGANVRIEVSDRGCGLQDPEKVFKPFFTTKKSGMGMGLAICRSIIQAHQGRLWVVQHEDCGATFIFTIPALAGERQ